MAQRLHKPPCFGKPPAPRGAGFNLFLEPGLRQEISFSLVSLPIPSVSIDKMAEVIGLISALGGIAAAGLKVAKTIYSLADELGTAGARVKALATDTRALSFVCKSVKSRLERAKSIPDDGLKLAHEIGMLIKDEVDEIGSILEPLTSENGKRMSKTQKAKWMFTKSQIATRQVALDSLKGTLNLLLAILNFNEGEEDRSVSLQSGMEQS
jgi:hypothetical protein